MVEEIGTKLYANDVRILRPSEVTRLINTIPKIENKIKFQAMLYTGARYAEIKLLYENPKWFNGVGINMVNTKAKVRMKTKSRNIRLNPQGQMAVNQYLFTCTRGLPHRINWINNLKRWCDLAGIEPDGVGNKTTRKTFESWLVATYGDLMQIFLSQGHSVKTALQHYLNLGFTEDDKKEMKPYVDGWI